MFGPVVGPTAHAAIQLPRKLTKENRVEALRIVGLGTSGKILSDPFPLGGFSGFEFGISLESLPAEDLGRMGDRLATPQQDVSYPKLSIGKGAYNNLDFFLHFTPYNRQDELSNYGGMIRWGFYQAAFLPLSASVVAHINQSNIGNQLTTRSYGADLIAGINVDNVALFAGIGAIEASGTFMGGTQGITSNGSGGTGGLESEFVSGMHTVIGATIRFSNLFVALQMDRYTQQVFSGKFGVRY